MGSTLAALRTLSALRASETALLPLDCPILVPSLTLETFLLHSSTVMPILTISYGLQYYDKAVLGSASIFGIIKDLGLSTSTTSASGVVVTSTIRYSTANAAFYWGYIVVSSLLHVFDRRSTSSSRGRDQRAVEEVASR